MGLVYVYEVSQTLVLGLDLVYVIYLFLLMWKYVMNATSFVVFRVIFHFNSCLMLFFRMVVVEIEMKRTSQTITWRSKTTWRVT